MDRKIDMFAFKFLSGTSLKVAEVKVRDGQVEDIRINVLNGDGRAAFKSRLKKNPERWAIVFPFKDAYFQELEVSQKTPRNSLQEILRSNLEIALPQSMPSYTGAVVTCEGAEKQKLLQFIIPKERLPFCDEMEAGVVRIHPGAEFCGMSEIFHFPEDQGCLVLNQKEDRVELSWGVKGQLRGLRVIRGISSGHWVNGVRVTLQELPQIKNLYTWCEGRSEKELEKLSLEWVHLRSGKLSSILKGQEENLDLVATAVGHIRLSPTTSISVESHGVKALVQPNLRKALSLSLALLILLGGVYEALGLVRLNRAHLYQQSLSQDVQDIFHQFFKEGTPLVDPVKQVRQKLGIEEGQVENFILPRRFLEILGRLYQAKSDSIDVMRLSFDRGVLSLEGKCADVDALHQWSSQIRGDVFRNYLLEDPEWSQEERVFYFRMRVSL